VNETSRNQGWAITGGAIFLGLLFLAGVLQGSYWALAIPVAVLVFFVLGLVAWVGHTIATVQVEPETPIEPEVSSDSQAPQAS
jgi:fatty acid desaturase